MMNAGVVVVAGTNDEADFPRISMHQQGWCDVLFVVHSLSFTSK